MLRVIENPETPFKIYVDTELIRKIYICGRAPAGCSRFSIYLQTGDDDDASQVNFVFDARFNFGADVRKIVTNFKKDNDWGSEEGRHLPFPFVEGELFTMEITPDDDSFKVKVNGEDFMEYEQKLDEKTINFLHIDNDIELQQVKLK